jgi:hypothetical protein
MDWNRHIETVKQEITLHHDMVKKGRIPVDRSRLQRLQHDLRHCENMASRKK